MRLLDGFALCVVVVTSACTSFVVDESPDAGDAAVRTVTVPRTVSQVIPDDNATGLSDSATIEGECQIASIEIDIDIRHPWRGDVVISLASPTGIVVSLKGYSDNDEIDDVTGTYPVSLSPIETLSTVVGKAGAGLWTLKVADVDADDEGTLETWTLRLTCPSS